MQRPGFWDDQEAAARTSARHASAQRRLKTFSDLEGEVGDLDELAEMAAEDEEMAAELGTQLSSIERRLDELEEARLFSGTYDAGDAVVSVHAGAGGTDSQDWAEILLRMYLRWAERRGFEVEMKEASEGEEAGLKSATFVARGENAYGLFAAERGVHRLVRISPFDSSSRRHTSFAQVDVGPLVDESVEVEIDDADLRIDTYRASGAGGQHVNKTDSAVRITHVPTGVVVQCQNERSQTQNKAVAMQLLRSKLLELEERKRAEELAKVRGEVKDVAWGSQIRSYFLHPDQRVKDHRTGHVSGDTTGVLDGDLDDFVRVFLHKKASCLPAASSTWSARRPATPRASRSSITAAAPTSATSSASPTPSTPGAPFTSPRCAARCNCPARRGTTGTWCRGSGFPITTASTPRGRRWPRPTTSSSRGPASGPRGRCWAASRWAR
jgi:peptide chain release factor 2